MNESTPQQPVATNSNGLSVTSLILGIAAFLSGLFAILSIPAGIAAVITGIMSLKRGTGKGMAIAGIITGALGALTGLIVGLLMLMALPALQRNQQDTQVKNDVAATVSAVQSYRTNNQGEVPSVTVFKSTEFQRYMDSQTETDVTYTNGVDCEDQQSAMNFRLSAPLSNGEVYCQDQD